jgi:hypothetical protein
MGGPFIVSQGNLAIGVSEIRTCPDRGRTCLANLSRNWPGDWKCLIRDFVAEELG